jgi:uncharacterized membrane protein
MRSKTIFLCLLVGLVILCSVHLFLNADVWFDEAYSILYARQPVKEILGVHDVHPYGFYLVLHFWMKIFGDSSVSARIPALLFGIGAFCMLYLIAKKLFGNDKNFNAFIFIFGFLFAISPTTIYYFTEARMYSMGLFFCLVSFYFLLKTSEDGINIPFILSTAILPYIHYFTCFFILGEVAYCFVFRRGKRTMIIEWLMAFVLAVPIFDYFAMQADRIGTLGFQKVSFGSVLSTYYYMWFHSNQGFVSLLNTIFGLIFLICAVYLILRYVGKNNDVFQKKLGLFMLLWIIVPTVLLMVVNTFIMNLYHHRFFYFVGWIFIFATARAIQFLWERKGGFAICLSIFMIFFSVWNCVFFFSTVNKDINGVADFFSNKNCSETSIIVHETQFSNLPHIYYNEIHDCYKDYIVTDLSEKEMNAIGGNVIPEGRIFRNISELDQFRSFYYILSAGKIYSNNFNYTLAYNQSDTRIFLARRKW